MPGIAGFCRACCSVKLPTSKIPAEEGKTCVGKGFFNAICEIKKTCIALVSPLLKEKNKETRSGLWLLNLQPVSVLERGAPKCFPVF